MMKIKFFNWLLVIEILSILYIPVVVFTSSNVLRIVLGLPFLLFFPGYSLVSALFVNKNYTSVQEKKSGIDTPELLALSFGMSIAISGLIGLCLNYTSFGINLESFYYSILGFIIIVSNIAIARQARSSGSRLIQEFKFNLSGLAGSPFNKILTLILIVAVLGTVGTLIYTLASQKIGEKYTGFYVLGLNNKAQEYPVKVVVQNDRVAQVVYGESAPATTSSRLQVTLGIVSQEQKQTTYDVRVEVNDQPVNFSYDNGTESLFKEIVLQHGEEWQKIVSFIPPTNISAPAGTTPGKMKVEFLLYKDGSSQAFQTLHLWIDVVSG